MKLNFQNDIYKSKTKKWMYNLYTGDIAFMRYF